MHQLCFDIHHLVLTTAKCQLIVPPPRKHNAVNIFRSQSLKGIANLKCVSERAHSSCQGTQWAAYITKAIRRAFATEKTPNSLLHSKKHTLNWSMGNHKSCYSNYWTWKQQRFDTPSHPGSRSSDSANIILSMSIKDDVYSSGEWQPVWEVLPELKCCSYRIIENIKTKHSCRTASIVCSVCRKWMLVEMDTRGLLLRRSPNLLAYKQPRSSHVSGKQRAVCLPHTKL